MSESLANLTHPDKDIANLLPDLKDLDKKVHAVGQKEFEYRVSNLSFHHPRPHPLADTTKVLREVCKKLQWSDFIMRKSIIRTMGRFCYTYVVICGARRGLG